MWMGKWQRFWLQVIRLLTYEKCPDSLDLDRVFSALLLQFMIHDLRFVIHKCDWMDTDTHDSVGSHLSCYFNPRLDVTDFLIHDSRCDSRFTTTAAQRKQGPSSSYDHLRICLTTSEERHRAASTELEKLAESFNTVFSRRKDQQSCLLASSRAKPTFTSIAARTRARRDSGSCWSAQVDTIILRTVNTRDLAREQRVT